jgi:hypothetical protein
MAIWRHLLRPLLPWLARFAVAALLALGVFWIAGTLLIRRAVPWMDGAARRRRRADDRGGRPAGARRRSRTKCVRQ